MALPERVDQKPGERISLKTYEYLMTDRPILAAVPDGENRNYLQDKPGVWLVEPTDIEAMAKVIEKLAIEKFSGDLLSIDRAKVKSEVSYTNRAKEFEKVLEKVLASA